MTTYNSYGALTFSVPAQSGCTLPTLSEIQSYYLGGYDYVISVMYSTENRKDSRLFCKSSFKYLLERTVVK